MLKTFEPILFTFGAGDAGSVALDAPAAACIAWIIYGAPIHVEDVERDKLKW